MTSFETPSRSVATRLVATALVALLGASCVSTRLPPVSATGASFEPTADELELWQESRVEEESLRNAVALYDDPLLEDYLDGVAARLTPPAMAANRHIHYRVSVIEDPTLNAFAYPHGPLYVHTGLLARLENEDQLAAVLGHEMSHVEDRHMLRYRRSMQNKQVALMTASIAAAVILSNEEDYQWRQGDWAQAQMVGVLGDVILGLGLQLAFVAAVNGYGRDLEAEADQGGFHKLEAAGYDLAQAPRLYEILLAGSSGDAGRAENYFFGSHPRLVERVASARAYVASHGGAGTDDDRLDAGRADEDGTAALAEGREDGTMEGEGDGAGTGTVVATVGSGGSVDDAVPAGSAGRSPGGGTAFVTTTLPAAPPADRAPVASDDEFQRRMAPVVRDDARLNLEAGRLDVAEEELDRAARWLAGDAETQVLFARLHLARAVLAVDDAERQDLRLAARDALREAIRLDPDHPFAHRDLGLLLYEDGDPTGACRELGFYLELAPDAPDADRVDDYLLELRQLGAC